MNVLLEQPRYRGKSAKMIEAHLNTYCELLELGDGHNCHNGTGIKQKTSSPLPFPVLSTEKTSIIADHCKDEAMEVSESSKKASSCTKLDSSSSRDTQSNFAMRHMQDFYETMQEITVEPTRKDEPDVKAFFKILRKHRLQSKLTYVLTVACIVLTSHCVLTVKWLMPYLFSVWTPSLLLFRLVAYWKMKYQYFMLDFCYFANMYCFTYIWVAPSREDMFAVGFSIASGPLIWSLLVFRNSLVFHSLDKVTSLYIHLMPGLLTYVIRWYPEETSAKWHKPFPHFEFEFNFLWLVLVPLCFHTLHQIIYSILVNLILKPSPDYLNLFRYVTRKEKSTTFRLCNLFGPRYRVLLYSSWTFLFVACMLVLNPLWYNYFYANCVMMVFFIVVAVFNGGTYYVDVFSLGGIGKNRSSRSEIDSTEKLPDTPPSEIEESWHSPSTPQHSPVTNGKVGPVNSCVPCGDGKDNVPTKVTES